MGSGISGLLRAAWRRPLLTVVVISAVFALAGIFQHDLWTPDEPRDAQMGKEMLERGFSALPTLGGEPFLEKPPLFFWLVGAALKLFGVSDGVARLPAALANVASGLIAYALARRAAGRAAGVLAAVVLVTFSEFWSISHKALNDVLLTAFVAGGHLAFLVARDRFRAGRSTLPAFAAAGVCCGLGFLTKGVVAPLLLAGPVVLAVAALREWRFLGHVVVAGGTFCLAGIVFIAGPWVYALWNMPNGPEYVRICLVDQLVARSTGGSATIGAHPKGPFFYLGAVPGVLLPWTLALPAVWMGGTLRGPRFRRVALLAALFAGAALLLSLPSGKRELYLNPLLPVAAAILASWLARCVPARKADRVTAATLLGVLGGVLLLGGIAAVPLASGIFPVPAKVTDFAAAHGMPLIACLAALLVGGGALLVRAARRASDPARPFLGARVALGVAAVFLGGHLIARPLMNAGKSLREGSIALAAAVPGSGPLLGFEPDELTIAVVGFYTDRKLVSVPKREILPRLRAGPERHLMVVEKRVDNLPADVRAVLGPPQTIALSASADVMVYEYDPALDTGR